ncbi:MAG: hypothetical protein MUP76_11285 [Acidimicrobiia bacterium]|nr:hypothetical protein [Acidimicrobiia bacterium]
MNDQKRRRIDQIRDPEFIAGLDSVAVDALRERRDMCSDLDVELSFYRRMLHGRMDLLSFELRRRSGAETRSLMEALPEILAGNAESAPSRPPGDSRTIPIEAPDLPDVGKRPVDRALGDDFLARLPGLSEGDLEETGSMLAEVEADISGQRRAVFEALDLLQAELTRRYRDDFADSDPVDD